MQPVNRQSTPKLLDARHEAANRVDRQVVNRFVDSIREAPLHSRNNGSHNLKTMCAEMLEVATLEERTLLPFNLEAANNTELPSLANRRYHLLRP